jgi:hypothetical protein
LRGPLQARATAAHHCLLAMTSDCPGSSKSRALGISPRGCGFVSHGRRSFFLSFPACPALAPAAWGPGVLQARDGGSAKAAKEAEEQLAAVLQLAVTCFARPPLPALLHVGSLPAARAAVAEALGDAAERLLAAALARPPDPVAPLHSAKHDRTWAQPRHPRLTYDEVATLALLQVSRGWRGAECPGPSARARSLTADGTSPGFLCCPQPMLRQWWIRQDVDLLSRAAVFRVPWQADAHSLSAWQKLLVAVYVSDHVTASVPVGAESHTGYHLAYYVPRLGFT